MASLYSQSFHYYRIALKAFENYSEPNDALITIMFSTMFLEAVLNDTIASENMTLELYENFDIGPDKFEKYNFDFDLYIDRIAFFHKIQVLFEKNGKYDFHC